jgi:hypothetical protein
MSGESGFFFFICEHGRVLTARPHQIHFVYFSTFLANSSDILVFSSASRRLLTAVFGILALLLDIS